MVVKAALEWTFYEGVLCGRKHSVVVDRLNKLRNKADSFVHGVRDHVSVGHKISDTVKGKLSLGARIINSGGFEGVFRKSFSVVEDEKLLKASQCYMSTTAGPVAGVLFVSTERIGFCSERAIKVSSTVGNSAKVPYKVLIPLKKVKGAFSSENTENPNQKYMYIVTVDGFEFWFMGFVNYKKTFKSVQKAILVSGTFSGRHYEAVTGGFDQFSECKAVRRLKFHVRNRCSNLALHTGARSARGKLAARRESRLGGAYRSIGAGVAAGAWERGWLSER
ncbi:putative GEM-like protein 8 [Dendrobium catenatum]|uniref:putative GEM-like protein 8 n=1 Tax=Dendrobium catenatum TaxID=906689 RepID=UPI00109F9CE3|nr:putative GEM-like protein 8 [Dendrobium catenatum]